MMRFFDAHCDAVMRAYDRDIDFVGGNAEGHVDLMRLEAAGHCAQVFAVFGPRSYYAGRDVPALARQAVDTICRWAETSGGRMKVALTGEDVMAACAPGAGHVAATSGRVAAIIGLEGCDALEGIAGRLVDFFAMGVRLIIPAWDDNEFAGSATGGGGPLTAPGFELVELAQALGVMVDASHLSDAAFEQLCTLVQRPFVASHSNCRALAPSRRNLTDAQIRALADRGGVMGINLAPDFLDADYLAAWDRIMAPAREAGPAARQKIREAAGPHLRAIPLPGLDRVASHVRHAIDVGGEACVGLGGDLDGISFMPKGFTGVESYPLIVDALEESGLTPSQVEKVCWRNMARVFAAALG